MAMESLDCSDVNEATKSAFGSITMSGDKDLKCRRCGFGGCDVRVLGCGCTFHGRCIPLSQSRPIINCPSCKKYTTGLVLFPLNFHELDDAKKTSAALSSSNKRYRKRKNTDEKLSLDVEKSKDFNECRTGRWRNEEIAFVDELIGLFDKGELPMLDGIKLIDFLSGMLMSKQSRLTKKMKNAKLSSKSYKRNTGYIVNDEKARKFSDLEDAFYHSIQDLREKAEIKFHMQKNWRELFSNFCVTVGQSLDASVWLTSVDELDRRRNQEREATKLVRRKIMMGNALRKDGKNPDRGVFIEPVHAEAMKNNQNETDDIASIGAKIDMDTDTDDFLNLLSDSALFSENFPGSLDVSHHGKQPVVTSSISSSPYLAKVIAYIQRHNIPFEHVDAWVPSILPENGTDPASSSTRLCYAGSATANFEVLGPVGSLSQPIKPERRFNLEAFGNYSEKFSFDVGGGLPGRVYQSGIPSWEQSVHNAPAHHFERAGGAKQCGVRTVIGVPVPSPNVGRIVIAVYSCYDRQKDQEMVSRMVTEFTRLMPSPKWKLVIDLGEPQPALLSDVVETTTSNSTKTEIPSTSSSSSIVAKEIAETGNKRDPRIDEVVSILAEHMPSDPNSPLASCIPGFISLRLLLLRSTWDDQESDLVKIMLGSYSSYLATGRSRSDIALLLARDCMFMQDSSSPGTTSSQMSNKSPDAPTRLSLDSPSFFSLTSSNNLSMNGINHINKPPNNAYTTSRSMLPPGSKIPRGRNGLHDTISIVSN